MKANGASAGLKARVRVIMNQAVGVVPDTYSDGSKLG